MHTELAALLLHLAAATQTPPDSTPARVVRRFAPIEVVGGRIHDMRSSETVHRITAESLSQLPITSLADAVGLQNGVVAVGEDLHVRGGRSGELQWSLLGIALNEPLGERAPELPLFAISSVELLDGGLEATHGGSLAGVLDLHTFDPTPQPSLAARWLTGARLGNGGDHAAVRASSALPRFGLGWVAAADAELDDQGLPALRSRGRKQFLGSRFGWRNDNHLRAWAKLAPLEQPRSRSLEVFASRVVRQPYNPMFAFDDSIRIAYQPSPTSPDLDTIAVRYRAADHALMSDERTIGGVLSAGGVSPVRQWRASLGWVRQTSLTSVGLRPAIALVLPADRVRFGDFNRPDRSPFLAYSGDTPYLRRSLAQRWLGSASYGRQLARGQNLKLGLGASLDEVQLHELDDGGPEYHGVDTLRQFHAWAPGGFAFLQHRWEQGGLLWNAGLRLQLYTAGPQAAQAKSHWSWAPRFGFAYPVSVRDAFSLSYVRLHQPPAREYLYDSRLLIYNRNPLGNEQLTPSEVISWQAALKHRFDDGWSMQASVFYRDVFAQVGVRNDPFYANTYRPRYQSIESGSATGYEFALLGARRDVGEWSLRYTYMNAYGSMSDEEGWNDGPAVGERAQSIGTHPLDWDRQHLVTLDLSLRARRHWSVAWITQAQSGAPWTPTSRVNALPGEPTYATGLGEMNTRRLPWSETSTLAVRYQHRWLARARLALDVRNVFNGHVQQDVSVSGYPNPFINTQNDEYAGYRTDTGRSGGGYFNDPDQNGFGQWIAVDDPRLFQRPRAMRLGLEWGL